MSNRIRISGFTIVRNARILDYPFEESVRSLLPVCDEFIINCGDSDDETWEVCELLERENRGRIRLIRSVWERRNQHGGFQLKHQTDMALAECRGEWCFYLQADEVIHEKDLANAVERIHLADNKPEVDGIVFDYLHFYGNYSHIIRGRSWYRREVRAFKNGRGIAAFRDAQGFRKANRRLAVISANSRIFHYGYVRTSESMRRKSAEMSRWWNSPSPTSSEALQLRRHVGLSRFEGEHPSTMASRISNDRFFFDPSQAARKWDLREIKDAITIAWEKVFPLRFGEFKNYTVID